jgi:hypothetical protein
MRKYWHAFLHALDAVGRALTFWVLGGSAVITALAGWGLSALGVIPRPVLIGLLIGLFLLAIPSLGLAIPKIAPGLAQTPAIPATTAPVVDPKAGAGTTGEAEEAAAEASARLETEYVKALRIAIHEAITTLEYHQGSLRNWKKRHGNYNPGYQGNWAASRLLLAERSRNDLAVRSTERALEAVSHVNTSDVGGDPDEQRVRTQALRLVNKALEELDGVLKWYAS